MARMPRRAGGRRSQPSTPRTARTSNPTTPSSGRGSDGLFSNGEWFCDCKPRHKAVKRETRKPGANKGRWFYTCPQERRRQCTFFLWEDFAGVNGGGGGGGGAGADAGAGPSSSRPQQQQQPRPTYRTSIGQRTTPPAERQDAPRSTLAGQRSLPPPAPPPAPPPTTRQRQRIFTTPTGSRALPDNMNYGPYEAHGGRDEGEGEDDDYDQLPPTPTPMRTRRPNSGGALPPSQPPLQPPPPEIPEPPTAPAEAPSHPITKYFGVVKKSGGGGGSAAAKQGQGPRALATRNTSDYSDSEFDSDMERALVALADHGERATRRKSGAAGAASTAAPAAGREARIKIKQEETDGGGMAMDVEDAADGRRGIIVPVHEGGQREEVEGQNEQEQLDTPPGRRRSSRRLLVASGEYAAKEVAAAEASAANDTTTASFASLFGGSGGRGDDDDNDNDGDRQWRQPHRPMYSFSSSVPSSQVASSQAASSQALTQTSIDTTTLTTPPSSFRSDAGAGTRSSGQKRKQAVDPWYGAPTQDGGNDDDSDDNDPFMPTPSKRVRFREALNNTGNGNGIGNGGGHEDTGRQEMPSLATTKTPTRTPTRSLSLTPRLSYAEKGKQKESIPTAPRRQQWDEDDGMHVDGDGGDEEPEGGAGRGALVLHQQQQHQPKDHNVTLAVLQLLAGQPVDPRVRQQVRALLNGAFDE